MQYIYLCDHLAVVDLTVLLMPPKKRPAMTHITRTRIGKLSRRVVSIAAEPTSTATTSAAEAQPTLAALSFAYTAEAIAAAVMCHLEQSGRLLPTPSATVLSPHVDTLPTIQPDKPNPRAYIFHAVDQHCYLLAATCSNAIV